MTTTSTPGVNHTRSFYELEERSQKQEEHHHHQQQQQEREKQPPMQRSDPTLIGQHLVVGSGARFSSPFGERRIIYADWVASGRAYKPIEQYIASKVLPLYANTHTSTSATGLQSSSFRDEARQVIQQSMNANTVKDVVLFTGSGATSAINKIASVLGLYRHGYDSANRDARPVVFVGPHEHHSNLLPWRESCADVVTVHESTDGTVDKDHLQKLLTSPEYAKRPLRIGSFSACSNVTGLVAEVDAITVLLHKHGALAFWDYACGAPYLQIDMNPVTDANDPDRAFLHKDAVFVSPHKLLGGINSPGVLVAKKALFQNPVPAAPNLGGGTVFFVRDSSQRYLSNRIEREEGGTPDVVGAIRAGLAFRLKDSIGHSRIAQEEDEIWASTAADLDAHPNIALLGLGDALDKNSEERPRHVAIFSFLIRFNGLFLHYNFVSALMNDLYGIQTRGGCMCAGPYALRLLGISDDDAKAFEEELAYSPQRCEYLRPGFTRFNFPIFMPKHERDFVVNAIKAIADHGWRLLPDYRFNPRTGEWKHKSRVTKYPGRLWLSDAELVPDPSSTASSPGADGSDAPLTSTELDAVAVDALSIMTSASGKGVERLADQTRLLSDEQARLCWFVMPSEAQSALLANPEPQRAPVAAAGEKQRTVEALEPSEYFRNIAERALIAHVSDNHNSAVLSDMMTDNMREVVASDAGAVGKPEETTATSTTPTTTTTTTTTTTLASSSSACNLPGDACFLPRRRDKFPARTGNEISAVNTNSSAVLTGKHHMDAATLFPKPPGKLMKLVGQAMGAFEMIKEGDRLLLGLSGGKDSLCLLHVLLAVQKRSPVKFELAAATIDPGTDAFDPSPLIPYMKSLGVEYHYIRQDIFADARNGSLKGQSICAFCARMKRGALYSCARANKFNVLVLAQHLDDFAESFLMSSFHNGALRTMKANYVEQEGDVRVIRPLAFVREQQTKDFSYAAKLPVINENCPACFEAPQERARIKKLLAKEEAVKPQIFSNIRRAITPLMDENTLEDLRSQADARNDKMRSASRQKQRQHQQHQQRQQRAGGKKAKRGAEVVSVSSASAGNSDENAAACDHSRASDSGSGSGSKKVKA